MFKSLNNRNLPIPKLEVQLMPSIWNPFKKKGGHVLMNLNTIEEVTRHRKVIELPVTDVIIKAVEIIDSSRIMKGIKIKNRENIIYHPTNWITLVEYEENDNIPYNPDMP